MLNMKLTLCMFKVLLKHTIAISVEPQLRGGELYKYQERKGEMGK